MLPALFLALLGSLRLLAFAGAAEDASTEKRALIVAQKTITAPETPGFLVQGKPFTVAYTVFNIGQLAAEDIAIDDAWAEADYVLLSGSPAKTWKSLAPGANETVEITVRPLKHGLLTSARASVSYKYRVGEQGAEDGEEEDFIHVSAQSTAPGRQTIITDAVYAKESVNVELWHGVATYVSVALIVVPLFLWRKAANKGAEAVKSA